jgi:hypothetical protein
VAKMGQTRNFDRRTSWKTCTFKAEEEMSLREVGYKYGRWM